MIEWMMSKRSVWGFFRASVGSAEIPQAISYPTQTPALWRCLPRLSEFILAFFWKSQSHEVDSPSDPSRRVGKKHALFPNHLHPC